MKIDFVINVQYLTKKEYNAVLKKIESLGYQLYGTINYDVSRRVGTLICDDSNDYWLGLNDPSYKEVSLEELFNMSSSDKSSDKGVAHAMKFKKSVKSKI